MQDVAGAVGFPGAPTARGKAQGTRPSHGVAGAAAAKPVVRQARVQPVRRAAAAAAASTVPSPPPGSKPRRRPCPAGNCAGCAAGCAPGRPFGCQRAHRGLWRRPCPPPGSRRRRHTPAGRTRVHGCCTIRPTVHACACALKGLRVLRGTTPGRECTSSVPLTGGRGGAWGAASAAEPRRMEEELLIVWGPGAGAACCLGCEVKTAVRR